MSPITDFAQRDQPDTIVLFDVDGTLTPNRDVCYHSTSVNKQQPNLRNTLYFFE
jgi:phosphomannomutase